MVLEENLRLKQLQLNDRNSQKKQTEKERLILVISSIRAGVGTKASDEVCIVTFHLFSLLYQSRSSCWKHQHYFQNCYNRTKMVEKNTTNLSVSPYCTLMFSRVENIKFPELVLVVVYCNCLISCFMIAWIFGLKYYQYCSIYFLACGKRQLQH